MQTHEASNCCCLVAHWDEKGKKLPQCVWCKRCHEFIQPSKLDEECHGLTERNKESS